MKNLILILLTCACTTYVPVKYRVPSEYSAPKSTPLKVEFSQKSEIDKVEQDLITEALEKEIVDDGWWTVAKTSNQKKSYRLIIKSMSFQSNPGHSSIEVNDNNERIRSAAYKTSGVLSFEIKHKENPPISFTVSSDATTSSEVEVPKPLNANKLLPVLGLVLLGLDGEREAIERQDNLLRIDSINAFRANISKEILNKITPNKITVQVEFDDYEKDMDAAVELIRAQDFEAAYIYLNTLAKEKKRADIFYNLGIVQELRGQYEEACGLYKRAYDMKSKSLYLKQNAACETRKGLTI